jgi:cytochrome b
VYEARVMRIHHLGLTLALRRCSARVGTKSRYGCRPATDTTATMPEAPLSPVRVWDLPTRVFHWLLAAAFIGSVVTAKAGVIVWHFRLGYLVLALLAFRVLWGLVGGRWSRFASFIYAPGTLLAYLRGRVSTAAQLDVGHTPTGALSVFALLGLLIVQVGTGLVADDEIANQGPLNRYVSSDTVVAATSWHKSYGQYLLITLVLLHVLAIVWYLVKKRVNLVRPMVSGDKPLPADTPASADGAAQRGLALVLIAACAALAVWVARQG